MFYSGDRFTEEEKLAIEGLTLLVAELYAVDYADIMSRSRKREVIDARKIICMYAYNNIFIASSKMKRSLSLSSWFFNCDHSTVVHAVSSGKDLYKTDVKFKAYYDSVIKIIDNENADDVLLIAKKELNTLSWSFVRKDVKEKLYTRYLLMPEDIKENVRELFSRGILEFDIAEKAGTTVDLIFYFIKRERLVINKVSNISRMMSLRKYKTKSSTSRVEY